MNKTALELLYGDYLKNCCIIRMLEDNPEAEAEIINSSVRAEIFDKDGAMLAILCEDYSDLDKVFAVDFKKYDMGFFVGEAATERALGMSFAKRVSACHQLCLPDSVPLTESEEGIMPLTLKDARTVWENYNLKKHIPLEYIEDRIKKGPALGIFEDGNLAGWVMTHDEGSMGVLNIREEYRRRGFASRLSQAMCRRMRERGMPCVVHIFRDNGASLCLAEKSGFAKNAEVVWVEF